MLDGLKEPVGRWWSLFGNRPARLFLLKGTEASVSSRKNQSTMWIVCLSRAKSLSYTPQQAVWNLTKNVPILQKMLEISSRYL